MLATGSQSGSTPSLVGHLSPAQQERLSAVLDRYLRALEQDLPVSREELLAEHADLAEPLRVYLDRIDELHEVAAGFVAANAGESEESASPRSERRLGDFLIGEEIGRGGMGIVYEAHQISLARPVALKILPFAAVLDAHQITRFKHEAQIAAQIQHPHIVPVYAIGHERGVHYYAMRRIDGQPMNRAIEELRGRRGTGRTALPRGTTSGATGAARSFESAVDRVFEEPAQPRMDTPLTRGTGRSAEYFREVARLGVQAADALHAAHEYGVLHRDVKPSNLLIDRAGKLWVTDFGLARIQSDVSLTRTGDVVGTAQYMSPEQAAGQSALVDARSDVYSVGATLYELLALRPPFAADGGPGGRRRSDEEPTSLRQLNPHVPLELETIVLKGMAARREDRYLTAQELARDLERFLAGEPILATPPTWSTRVARWANRHRSMARVAVATGLAALLTLAFAAVTVTRAKARAERNLLRAQHHFRQAQTAVDQFGWQLADTLREVPGTNQIRESLLRQALEYYQSFAKDAAEDPASRVELAVTHGKIAALQEQLGTTAAALAAYRQAVVQLKEIVSSSPESRDAARELARCQNNYGLALSRAGRIDEARSQLLAAIGQQQRLVEYSPLDNALAADLARFQANLGHLELQAGRLADSEAALQAARAGQLQLLLSHPQSAHRLRELAATLNHLGEASAPHQPEQAIRWYEEALRYDRQAVQLDPSQPSFQASLAQTWNNLGALLAKTGNVARAQQAYREAIALQQPLADRDPWRKSIRQELAVSYNNLGLAHHRQGDTTAAVAAFQQALKLERELLEFDPVHPEWNSSCGGTHNNLGLVFEQSGQLAEAAESFREAVARQEIAFQKAVSVARYRDFLSKHYYNYSRVLRRTGKFAEAGAATRARRDLWNHDPNHLLAIAEEFEQLAAADASGGFAEHRWSDWIVETLEKAVQAGLPQASLTANRFPSVAQDPRFLKIVRP